MWHCVPLRRAFVEKFCRSFAKWTHAGGLGINGLFLKNKKCKKTKKITFTKYLRIGSILLEGTPCRESIFRGFLRMSAKDVKQCAKLSVLPLSGAERLGSLLGKVVSPI